MLSDDALARRLRELPDLAPPEDGLNRLRQRAMAESLIRSADTPAQWRWLALAATVVVAIAVGLVLDGRRQPATTVPAVARDDTAVPARVLKTVVRRSQLLDEALRYSPPTPEVVPVAYASRAAAIEDRIAAIDRRLLHGGPDMDAGEQVALWSERVAMMTSLVELKYGSASERSL